MIETLTAYRTYGARQFEIPIEKIPIISAAREFIDSSISPVGFFWVYTCFENPAYNASSKYIFHEVGIFSGQSNFNTQLFIVAYCYHCCVVVFVPLLYGPLILVQLFGVCNQVSQRHINITQYRNGTPHDHIYNELDDNCERRKRSPFASLVIRC